MTERLKAVDYLRGITGGVVHPKATPPPARMKAADYVRELTGGAGPAAAPSSLANAGQGGGEGRDESGKSKSLAAFVQQVALVGLPAPALEWCFHPVRLWRLDLAWPVLKIGVEYQGIFGQRTTSHASRSGLIRDYEKGNEAQLEGWLVLYLTAKSVESGEGLAWLKRAFEMRSQA